MRRALYLLLALALAGCSDEEAFTPASYVEKLRVLGVKAEPPQLAPGETTVLSALVADPFAAARAVTYVWMICDPAPDEPLGSACARRETVRDVTELFRNPPPGVRIVPLAHKPRYTAPQNALEGFAPGSLDRRKGATATVLLLVFEGMDPAALADDDVVSQFVVKRIRIADPEREPNRNPSIERVLMNDSALIPSEIAEARPGGTVNLSAETSADSEQIFERIYPDGSILPQKEQAVFSWYAMSGRYLSGNAQASRTTHGEKIAFQLPDADGVDRDGEVRLFVVLRDARGGIDWAEKSIRLAP